MVGGHGLGCGGDLVRAGAEWMGERQRHRAHSTAGKSVLAGLVHQADVAGRLGLADTNVIDGYVAVGDVAGVVSRHGLTRDEEGRVTLRATPMDLDVVRDLSGRRVVLAAPDLAESLDTREPRAGWTRSIALWRASVADRPTIEVASPAGGWGASLQNVAEIEAVLPHQKWTLVGGLLSDFDRYLDHDSAPDRNGADIGWPRCG